MNLRWLWLNHIDPAFGLSPQQRREVQRRIKSEARRFRAGFRPLDLAYVFVPLLITSIPIGLMQMNLYMPRTFSQLWTLLLPFGFAAWVTGAWIRWKMRQQLVNRTLRSIGVEVCQPCGYWLRDLPSDVAQCPECGAQREPMPEKAA